MCRNRERARRSPKVCEKGSGQLLGPEPWPGGVWGRAQKSPGEGLGAPARSPFEGLVGVSGLVVSVLPREGVGGDVSSESLGPDPRSKEDAKAPSIAQPAWWPQGPHLRAA